MEEGISFREHGNAKTYARLKRDSSNTAVFPKIMLSSIPFSAWLYPSFKRDDVKFYQLLTPRK